MTAALLVCLAPVDVVCGECATLAADASARTRCRRSRPTGGRLPPSVTTHSRFSGHYRAQLRREIHPRLNRLELRLISTKGLERYAYRSGAARERDCCFSPARIIPHTRSRSDPCADILTDAWQCAHPGRGQEYLFVNFWPDAVSRRHGWQIGIALSAKPLEAQGPRLAVIVFDDAPVSAGRRGLWRIQNHRRELGM
jgi:hypothetical protein